MRKGDGVPYVDQLLKVINCVEEIIWNTVLAQSAGGTQHWSCRRDPRDDESD